MKKILILTLFVSSTAPLLAEKNPYLEKYRSMALEYNHDLKAAEKNISASMELEKSARADLKPKLSANADFRYTGNPMELTAHIPSLESPISFQGKDLKYGASLSLLQPIYTGGQVLESIRMAKYKQSSASFEAEAIRSAICYQTDIQYWHTVARHEMIEVAADFRQSIFSLTETIKERVDAGLTDPQDLLMAEVKLNEAEYRLLQAKSNFETGRMALNSLIGVELHNPTEIERYIPDVNVKDSLLSENDGNNRPEIKIALDNIGIAESSLKLKDSQYKPRLFVGIEGSYSSPGYNFKSDLDPNYAMYAKLSVPIFEWGKRKSEKRASNYQIGMAKDQLNHTEDKIALEIQTAKLALAQAMKRSRLSENSLEKAQENEQKAMERYYEGKISILEVIDAQTYRQTAQINYIQAKVEAQSFHSELIKALNLYNYQ